MNTTKTIFKAEGANRGLVCVEQRKGKAGIYYVVVRNRKMLDKCARYWELGAAIDRAVDECYKDINKEDDRVLL